MPEQAPHSPTQGHEHSCSDHARTAEVPHPSEFIQEELDARGWSREELARRMGDDPRRNLLVLGFYYEVGPDQPGLLLGKETAAQLGKAFGVSSEYFLNLHSQWLAQHVH